MRRSLFKRPLTDRYSLSLTARARNCFGYFGQGFGMDTPPWTPAASGNRVPAERGNSITPIDARL
jgi:hypothetical protein